MANRYPIVLDSTGFGHEELGPSATDTLAVENLDVAAVLSLPMGSTFPTSPTDGQMWYDNTSGERTLYIYDGVRSKWLSSSEFTLGWGHDIADGELLRGFGISIAATGTGLLIPRDCTIVRVSGRQRAGADPKQVDLLVNGTSAFNFDLASNVYKNNAADVDLDEDDNLWVEVETGGLSTQDVAIILWLAWRG